MRAPLLLIPPLALLAACPKQKPPPAEPTPQATPSPAESAEPALDPKWPTILLDGARTSVRWSDGDSFTIKSGPHAGASTRLAGYNTLESYGPVHRWGDWSPLQLYAIAKSSWKLAASQEWACTSAGAKDHYGRLLVDCPDAALHLVGEGHGIVFALDEPPRAELLRAQVSAIKGKRGIWERGDAREVVTSLHSADEGGGKGPTYDRVVDTRTGMSRELTHEATYAECQEVCHDGGSCMVYVPYERRYKDKAPCLVLRKGKGEEDGAAPDADADGG